MSFFSLGVCAYNEAASIGRMLGRVLRSRAWASHRGEREIIVCANGCTDDTVSIVRDLQQECPELKLLVVPEKSKNLAWERIVAASDPRAQMLFFADADVLIHPQAFPRLEAELTDDPDLQIACGRVMPTAAYVRSRGLYYGDVVAIARFMRAESIGHLDGKLYAIRRSAAVEVSMPKDPRVADDYFLQIIFRGKTRVISNAVAVSRFPDLRGLEDLMVRQMVSKRVLREAPHYDDFLRNRRRRQRFGALKILPRVFLCIGPLRLLRVLAVLLKLKLSTSRRIAALVRSGQDSWRPILSSKLR